MKSIIEKFFFKNFFLILIVISFTILIYKFYNQHLVDFSEFKYIDWSLNIFSKEAVLSYYRPFFYVINNLTVNIFGLSLFSFKLINLIIFLLNAIIIIKISKKYLGNDYFYLIPLIFFLFNPNIVEEYSKISPFPLSQFFILINILLILLIIESKKNFFFILLGLINAFGSLCREELFLIFFINIIFFIFISEKKKIIFYYFITFIFVHLLFFIYLFNQIDFSKFLSIGLNVIDREINYSIRKYYYNLEYEILYNKIFDFTNKFEKQFSLFFLIKQFFLLSILYQLYLNYKKKIKNNLRINYLLFLISSFIIFYFFIRVASRLIILYEFLFIILLMSQIKNIKFENFNFQKLLFIFLLIMSFFKIYSNYIDEKYKPRLSINNIFYKEIIKNYNNQGILISPTSTNLIHGPEKYINGKPSENYSLSSRLYFGNEVLLFSDLLKLIKKRDNNLDDINLEYIIIQVDHKSGKLLFKKENLDVINKILNLSDTQVKNFRNYKLKADHNLKLYGGNDQEYFEINGFLFNSLLLKNFNINKIFKFEKNILKLVSSYNDNGYYLIHLREK